MIEQIPIARIDSYREHFPGPHLALVLASIAAGNTGGLLWQIAQPGELPLVLLWDKGNRVLYFAGAPRSPAALGELANLAATRIRPQALAERTPYFKARALDPRLEPHLPQILDECELRAYPTRFYVDGGAPQLPTLPSTVAELALASIDRKLLEHENLANRDQVLAEIRWMWPSEERFYAQGFGIVAIARSQIVCWCTAEYVGPARCGIGITTVPAYERQGIATATAARFVLEARGRGLTPCWECGQANRASLRVAEKLGFACQAEEHYWIGSFAL